jgi:hypothetical protein
MKKLILAAAASLGLFAASAEAAPPGFYAGGYYSSPFPAFPAAQGFNYFSSPYGYRTYSSYGTALTPWGFSNYNFGGTFVRPYVNGRFHSVYWDPFANTYQYNTGFMNTPTFYQFYRFGW